MLIVIANRMGFFDGLREDAISMRDRDLDLIAWSLL